LFYRGELLPGFYEDWILTEREHLAELYRQALRRLTQALTATEQFDEAIEIARQAITTDNLCEGSHCALIRLFARTGRLADALRQYEELERLLREEVHSSPATTTRELMEQVRSGALTASSAGIVLQTPAVSPQSPPVRPVLPPIPSLPVPMTRFFGREEEIEQLKSLLSPPRLIAALASPLVTLTGPGGAGKTRLALEVAQHLCPEYAEAVWFVPLADVTRPELIADAIIETLSLSRSVQSEPLEQVAEFLHAYPAALLILDNFEHLQEEGTPFVQALRRRLPRLSYLITSRHKLNLEGERDITLHPLKTPDAAETPEQLLAYPSVQLFLDRAQAARYSFALTQDNAEAVSMLGQRLEGIPLAIELAAAWAATLTPEQILLRLSRRFDLLISRRKDIPERHRSLQAVLEGSYQLLPPKLQHLYTYLSVFRGGWTLEAAEQIAGVQIYGATGHSHILDGLAVLQERSFLQAEERGAEMRYRLLESLREFGAEQLQNEERFELAKRHAEYFLALAEEAQERLRTPEEKRWFDRLEVEYDNLRSALEWAIDNDTEIALQLPALLGNFWMTRGLAREGSEWLQKALARPGEMSPSRANALAWLSLMHLARGEYKKSEEFARASVAAMRALEDEQGMARTLNALGSIVMEQGNYVEAQNCYGECLRLYRASGHRKGESIALVNLGNVFYGRGEYDLACTYYNECLTVRRDLGDQRGIASVLDYLARAVREQGDYQQASNLHSESLAMRRELNDKPGIVLSLNHLGRVKTYLDEPEAARALLEESLVYCQEIGDKTGRAEALAQLGELSRREQNDTAARAYWWESLALLHTAGEKSGIAELFEAFAGVAKSEAQLYNAAQLLSLAEAIRDEISNPIRSSIRARYDEIVTAVCEALGQERFQQAWTEGRSLTLEQAIRLTK
jgi:predicted ATPase